MICLKYPPFFLIQKDAKIRLTCNASHRLTNHQNGKQTVALDLLMGMINLSSINNQLLLQYANFTQNFACDICHM